MELLPASVTPRPAHDGAPRREVGSHWFEPDVPHPSSSDSAAVGGCERVMLEQAKGVLVLRYGIGSYEALGVLARWSREAEVSLAMLACALVRGVCQGRLSRRDGFPWLVRWLEQRLREDVPDRR